VGFQDFNFDERVNEGIDAMGFQDPTPVQTSVIPIIMQGKDLVATAQTGTGKTAAFLLPLIHRIITEPEEGFYIKALIISPTRELVQQIDQQLNGMAYFAGVSSIAIFGGGVSHDWDQQRAAIVRGTDVLVATPGRLISHLNLGYVDMSRVKYLILDEADRMLDMGFLEDIMNIISFLPKQRQNLLFSATMPSDIRKLTEKILHEPETVSLSLSKPAEGVMQVVYPVFEEQKADLIRHLLKDRDLRSVLVFSSTKKNVRLIASRLAEAGLNVKAIHSDLEQAEREKVLLDFRNRKVQILIATDVMSRGIDVDGIDLVLNFDVPNDAEDYVHRVGRTARAASTGLAITFVSPREKAAFLRIERLIEQNIRRMPMPEALGKGPDLSSGGGHFKEPQGQRTGKPRQGGKSSKSYGKKRRNPGRDTSKGGPSQDKGSAGN
jgi:superfamily II DNA/RNA helicase